VNSFYVNDQLYGMKKILVILFHLLLEAKRFKETDYATSVDFNESSLRRN